MTITLTNKALLTSYGFDAPLTLTFLQGVVTVVALDAMRLRGWITFPAFNLSTARDVLPLSIVFVSYVVISLVALSRVNVPMFTALRRLQILFTMAGECEYSKGARGMGGVRCCRTLGYKLARLATSCSSSSPRLFLQRHQTTSSATCRRAPFWTASPSCLSARASPRGRT